jgi:hypothetical protein
VVLIASIGAVLPACWFYLGCVAPLLAFALRVPAWITAPPLLIPIDIQCRNAQTVGTLIIFGVMNFVYFLALGTFWVARQEAKTR